MEKTLETLSDFLTENGFVSSKGIYEKYLLRKGNYVLSVAYYVGSKEMLYTVNGKKTDVSEGFGSQVFDETMSYSLWIQKDRETLASISVADIGTFPTSTFKTDVKEFIEKIKKLAD